jgi:hypothetical protein
VERKGAHPLDTDRESRGSPVTGSPEPFLTLAEEMPPDRGMSGAGRDIIGSWNPRSREETAMDFHQLSVMTIGDLREMANGIEGLTGYTQMRKQELLVHICEHLNIQMHEHHDVVGIDTGAIKRQIQELKHQRDAALEAHDRDELRRVRRHIHKLKRRIRRATV